MNRFLLKQFFYWMNERHNIYLAKEAGSKPPWTKDKILQEYKFTNPFRQNDRVTKELTKRKKSLGSKASIEDLFSLVIMFRMFNLPATYDVLSHLVDCWGTLKAISILNKRKKEGHQIFTGAYIITNNGKTEPKINLVCKAVGAILKDKDKIIKELKEYNTLEHAAEVLCRYDMVGGFIAYELVTDLRHTKLLYTAKDIYTWANPGPGAHRGLNRIHGRDLKKKAPTQQAIEEMQQLLSLANSERANGGALSNIWMHYIPRLEMRDIEHSLCEFDKYIRVKNGEGRPRSKYKGGKQ